MCPRSPKFFSNLFDIFSRYFQNVEYFFHIRPRIRLMSPNSVSNLLFLSPKNSAKKSFSCQFSQKNEFFPRAKPLWKILMSGWVSAVFWGLFICIERVWPNSLGPKSGQITLLWPLFAFCLRPKMECLWKAISEFT